jgi:hypothetical protein
MKAVSQSPIKLSCLLAAGLGLLAAEWWGDRTDPASQAWSRLVRVEGDLRTRYVLMADVKAPEEPLVEGASREAIAQFVRRHRGRAVQIPASGEFAVTGSGEDPVLVALMSQSGLGRALDPVLDYALVHAVSADVKLSDRRSEAEHVGFVGPEDFRRDVPTWIVSLPFSDSGDCLFPASSIMDCMSVASQLPHPLEGVGLAGFSRRIVRVGDDGDFRIDADAKARMFAAQFYSSEQRALAAVPLSLSADRGLICLVPEFVPVTLTIKGSLSAARPNTEAGWVVWVVLSDSRGRFPLGWLRAKGGDCLRLGPGNYDFYLSSEGTDEWSVVENFAVRSSAFGQRLEADARLGVRIDLDGATTRRTGRLFGAYLEFGFEERAFGWLASDALMGWTVVLPRRGSNVWSWEYREGRWNAVPIVGPNDLLRAGQRI